MLKAIFSKKFWKESSWYLTIPLLFIFIGGVYSLYYQYSSFRGQIENDLSKRVELISKVVRPYELNNLNAISSDSNLKDYKDLKYKLESIRLVTPDLRFIHILLEREGQIYFVADSEPEFSSFASTPGKAYIHADSFVKQYTEGIYNGGSLETKVSPDYIDNWGNWIAAYTPMQDEVGRLFVVGIYLDYSQLQYKLLLNLLIMLMIFVFALFVFLTVMYIRYKEMEVLQNKTVFISIASHDIRSPLTGLRWLTESILKKSETKDKASIEQIHETVVGLINLVNDFLEYIALEGRSSVAKEKKQFITISQLVNNSIELLKNAANDKKVKIKLSGLSPSKENAFGYGLMADVTKLSSAISNLISNAIKYSFDGGLVDITVDFYSFGKKEKISELNINKYKNAVAKITVTDHGIGIPEKDQKKVFEGMFRTELAKNHTTMGTGLGLHLAKKVLENHRGIISLKSKEQQGTSISVELPIYLNSGSK